MAAGLKFSAPAVRTFLSVIPSASSRPYSAALTGRVTLAPVPPGRVASNVKWSGALCQWSAISPSGLARARAPRSVQRDGRDAGSRVTGRLRPDAELVAGQEIDRRRGPGVAIAARPPVAPEAGNISQNVVAPRRIISPQRSRMILSMSSCAPWRTSASRI